MHKVCCNDCTVTSCKYAHVHCHRSCNALETSTRLAETPSRSCLWLWQPSSVLQECWAPGPCWRAHRYRSCHSVTCKCAMQCRRSGNCACKHIMQHTGSDILSLNPKYTCCNLIIWQSSRFCLHRPGLYHAKAFASKQACLFCIIANLRLAITSYGVI